jgi:riboflavin synthase alpha subunit
MFTGIVEEMGKVLAIAGDRESEQFYDHRLPGRHRWDAAR